MLLSEAESPVLLSHATALMPLIDNHLNKLNLTASDLNAVSVSSGPGSYTGLRIGVSTAKGICHALNIPLISVGSLHAAAWGLKELSGAAGSDLLIPLIDARRMEAFAAIYDSTLKEVRAPHPWIFDVESMDEFGDVRLFLGGSGAAKLKEMFADRDNVLFIDNELHRASFSCKIAFDKFCNSVFESTAYFEPDYGKDFVPGKPVVKGLK